MQPGSRRARLRACISASIALCGLGCGASPITAARIETALAKTFANLVHVQVSRLGLPTILPAEFAATASCRRLTVGSSVGSGEWVCTVAWQGIDRRQLRDIYDLFVGTDGCYTATVESGALGGPTLQGADGSDVRNLLFAFDGCFDTTSPIRRADVRQRTAR